MGFLLTLFSINLATAQFSTLGSWVAWLLLPGPVLGLIGLSPLLRAPTADGDALLAAEADE